MRNILIAIICTAGIAASAQNAKSDEWKTKLESIIRQYHSNAVVNVQDGTYTYRYHTQTFKVHSIQMTGEVSKEARDEEGPNVDGILMTVRLEKGEYRGQAVVPQVLTEPYWRTFINAYPVSLPGGAHLRMSLSFGSKTDKKLIRALETCFGAVAPMAERSSEK